MIIGRNTGFRCPNCGAASPWEVDECDACGYRTEAMRVWDRDAKHDAEGYGCSNAMLHGICLGILVSLLSYVIHGIIYWTLWR